MTSRSVNKIRVNTYAVLCRAIEEGASAGWRRAHKHSSEPGEDAIILQIVQAILDECCEYLVFEDP